MQEARFHHVRFGLLLAAAVGSLAFAPKARGVVVTGLAPMSQPASGWVGTWNGSSCVAVGPYWFVTAKHVGGSVGQNVVMRGVTYRSVEIRQHPTYDVQVIRVAEATPGYHMLAMNAGLGDPCVLGGWGVTGGSALANNAGYDWNGARQETWGANMIEGDGNLLAVRFDAPSAPESVPFEAIFAVNDSGAGLFVYGTGGELELAGIAVSVMGWGSAQWGNAAFALNVDMFRSWLQPIVDTSQPISSGVMAPRAAFGVPMLPSWAGGVAMTIALAGLRRRR